MGGRPEAAAEDALMMTLAQRWNTSRKDWAQRIVARQPLLPTLPIDTVRADKALRIFKRFRLVEVAGQPTMGQACDQWVFDFVRAIFGAYDAEAKRRVVREFFLLISKKNSKSSIAAGVMLTALILHDRHAAEFLILAPTKDVADNSFLPAYRMVKADPALLKAYRPSDSTRAITNVLDGAVLEVKSADAEVVGGQKAQCVFVDELWLFGKKASAKNILSEAVGSLASQPDGFVIYASTQSDDPPTGVFREKLDYHRDVRDGVIEDHTALPLIYEYPKVMQEAGAWKDRSTWFIPNPNLGRSVDIEFIASEMQKAERAGPDSVRLVAAKHLNVQVGVGLRTDRWAGAEYWERAEDADLARIYRRAPFDTLHAMLDRCEIAVVGFDGGGLDDLAGLNVLGREPDEVEVEFELFGRPVVQRMKRWLSWSHAWCHVGVLERRKTIATKLEEFKSAGELTMVDDDLIDIASIVEIVRLIKERGKLGGVAIDPAGLSEFADALEAAKLDVTVDNRMLFGAPQGFAMMNSIKSCERRVAKRMLLHCGGKLMPWAVGNLKIEPTATAIRATKQNAGDAKIDCAMALFNSATLMATNPAPAQKPKFQMFVV